VTAISLATDATTGPRALLDVTDLRVRYGAVDAVRGISLSVAEGGVLALLGNNGAGKSSTLNCLAGLVRPTAGAVRLAGRDITGLPASRVASSGISLVPEGRRVFASLTVAEHLDLAVWGAGVARRQRASRLQEVYDLFPMFDRCRRQVASTLSGGEQQQLALGRALVAAPRVLLLDEPSLGLAPILVDRVFACLHLLKQQGMTMVVVEQNARHATELADQVVVLSAGRVVAAGHSRDFSDLRHLRAIYLGHAEGTLP
jgi:branched-chain amino acid transport system ATP-binding protein